MSFRQSSGWKSLSLSEAKARAGVRARGMTTEEEQALRPALKSVPLRVTFKTGKLKKCQQERYRRAITVDAWAQILGRPFTVKEGCKGLNMSESSFKSALALTRIKLVDKSVSRKGGVSWHYAFDEKSEIESPASVLQRLGGDA